MQERTLGELKVSAIGFGCMALSEFYGSPLDDDRSISLIRTAIENGITLFDTSDMYGMGRNEELLGKAIKGHREKVTVATKVGIIRKKEDPNYREVCGEPAYIKIQCENSLKRLGIDTIDLYYIHRVDSKVPVEETIGAMKELITEGKVRSIGLSETHPETIRKAHAVHPITALETEYSLWSRDPEREVFEICKELNIGFVAHSPLGRGFLTGKIKSANDIPADDFRRTIPRFQGDHLDHNLKIVEIIEIMAKVKKCTSAQLALAWVLAHPLGIIPLFGTRHQKHIIENCESINIKLSAEELKKLNEMLFPGIAKGERYPAVSKKYYPS